MKNGGKEEQGEIECYRLAIVDLTRRIDRIESLRQIYTIVKVLWDADSKKSGSRLDGPLFCY